MVLFVILSIVFFVLWRKAVKQAAIAKKTAEDSQQRSEEYEQKCTDNTKELNQLRQEISEYQKSNDQCKQEISTLKSSLSDAVTTTEEQKKQISALSKYQQIVDVDAEIEKKRNEFDAEVESTRKTAADEISSAKQTAKDLIAKGNLKYNSALDESKRIIAEAENRAKEIAGDAYEIAGKAKEFEKVATAMKNIVDGYGDQYLKPTYSLLDDLAADFGYTEAGQQLKIARANTARLVTAGAAAVCDYVEDYRKRTAIAFVTDAFNGKVDSILSKVKKDNYGILEQKIKDAYEVVNYNGRAFRNAVITPEFLSARLEELKWAVRTQELKAQAQEEQRQIREQMREEERARKEYEKAMKDAAKEEEMLRKAMERAQQQIDSATEANRAAYEAKLTELKQKLAEAEERGQRAISMAQQTKHGNVYVISNVGSFGENVYKVGMTRRLDPMDRVRELGDASVPFPFDVHAIIESDDAPALETTLHKALSLMQVNKVNPRKEFFRVPIADIKTMVDKMGLNTAWTMDAAATEYRETLAIEESMKTDPDARRRWEEYTENISKNQENATNDEDA